MANCIILLDCDNSDNYYLQDSMNLDKKEKKKNKKEK